MTPLHPFNANASGSSQSADKRKHALVVAVILLSFFSIVLGIAIGSTGLESLMQAVNDPVALKIILDIRLPRTLGAWLAGALLGLAGALAQGLFRNPLADPYLLGSASGASLGVALVLMFYGYSTEASSWAFKLGLSGAAFLGALASVGLTLILSRGVQHTFRLLLAGIIVGVVLGALTSLTTLFDPSIIQSMQSFLLGTTSFINWGSVRIMLVALMICLTLTWTLSKALDALSLGESTASSLGINLSTLRIALIAALALATGVAVAETGLIAFVGLAAPHLVRSLVKVTHNWLVLLSSLMGGLLLLSADLVARILTAPGELPVGLFTAVIGGIYLLRLMHSQNTRHEGK